MCAKIKKKCLQKTPKEMSATGYVRKKLQKKCPPQDMSAKTQKKMASAENTNINVRHKICPKKTQEELSATRYVREKNHKKNVSTKYGRKKRKNKYPSQDRSTRKHKKKYPPQDMSEKNTKGIVRHKIRPEKEMSAIRYVRKNWKKNVC